MVHPKTYGYIKKKILILICLYFSFYINADSFNFNTYNNHGVIGLINMPTARFYDEAAHGITVYDGTPPQKITLTSNPYDWLEASFFYTNIQGKPYPGFEYQDFKDKGFNFKLRLKEEGTYPAIAIGINDIAGTGLFSSEYIVGSYGINNFDIHFGIGWGTLNGSPKIKNPFGYLYDGFKKRPDTYEKGGGQFQLSRYFSSTNASPFYGASYVLNSKTILKFEKDTTAYDVSIDYPIPKSDFSFGVDYLFNDNFTIGLSYERGNYASLKFTYKNNPQTSQKKYKYKKGNTSEQDNIYTKLIKNLEENGIGVNKIAESANTIGLELTQFIHPDIKLVEEIISTAAIDAGIKKDIKKDIKIADLSAVTEIDKDFEDYSNLIYQRKKSIIFNSSNGIKFRPFLASREEFFKGAFLFENDSELIIKDNLIVNTNLKYSIYNNFEDLRFPPVDTYPAQVRSDVKEYLKNMNNGVLIGRAQLDYYLTPVKDNHLMISGGILEDMFNGYGFEYLYFKQLNNYAVGFEMFKVQKRDYDWGFGTLGYDNTIGSVNFYYRNYNYIPFDMKLSYGEYLAGDKGSTIEFSRTYRNGVQFGVFASNTNVSFEQFGEGSFDKGIFFNIPVYGNFINYTWRPLTKDPAAKLNRRNTLYDLLVRFRPINE